MSETLLTRVPREQLSENARIAWDALNELTGTPTFVDVFAQAPELLEFAMVHFYQKIFFEVHTAGWESGGVLDLALFLLLVPLLVTFARYPLRAIRAEAGREPS